MSRPRAVYADEQRAQMQSLYASCKSATQVAQHLGCSVDVVLRTVKPAHAERRRENNREARRRNYQPTGHRHRVEGLRPFEEYKPAYDPKRDGTRH